MFIYLLFIYTEIVHDSNATAHVIMCENIDININDIPLPSSPPPTFTDYSFDMETSYVDDVENNLSDSSAYSELKDPQSTNTEPEGTNKY